MKKKYRMTPAQAQELRKRLKGKLKRAVLNMPVEEYYQAEKDYERIPLGNDVIELNKGEVFTLPSAIVEGEVHGQEDFKRRYVKL